MTIIIDANLVDYVATDTDEDRFPYYPPFPYDILDEEASELPRKSVHFAKTVGEKALLCAHLLSELRPNLIVSNVPYNHVFSALICLWVR